jgi:hypothetical protein
MFLLVGVVAGGGMNLLVQILLDRVRRQRELRLAARVVYDELMEYGYREINSEQPPSDASHLHTAWREHRAALVDLGQKDWSSIEDAVMAPVYPDLQPPRRPESHNSVLEKACGVLEPHAGLPREMRGFT